MWMREATASLCVTLPPARIAGGFSALKSRYIRDDTTSGKQPPRLPRHSTRGDKAMKVRQTLLRLICDEGGGEVLEYALVAGLIVIAAIAAISTVGTKVLARWTSLQNSM